MGAEGYAAWAHSTDEVASHYQVDLQGGLTDAQVAEARERYGTNELEKKPGKALWRLVLEQFDDMLVKVTSAHYRSLCKLPGPTTRIAKSIKRTLRAQNHNSAYTRCYF